MNIEAVAQSIGKMIKEGKDFPCVEKFCQDLINKGEDLLPSLLHTVVCRVDYEKEPAGRDVWQDPKVTWTEKTGDCEDFTILIGSALLKLGKLLRLKFVSTDGKNWNHIYPLGYDGKNWRALDATLNNPRVGDEPFHVMDVVYGVNGGVYCLGESIRYSLTDWFIASGIIIIVLFILITQVLRIR